jgi:hypothetical protein
MSELAVGGYQVFSIMTSEGSGFCLAFRKTKFQENRSLWRFGRLHVLITNAFCEMPFDACIFMYLHVLTTKQQSVGSDMWGDRCKPALMFYSEVFHKLSDMWFTLCRHVQQPETDTAVPLKLEKYLSWESQLRPDQERCVRSKPEEVSFCPVVFGLGYN